MNKEFIEALKAHLLGTKAVAYPDDRAMEEIDAFAALWPNSEHNPATGTISTYRDALYFTDHRGVTRPVLDEAGHMKAEPKPLPKITKFGTVTITLKDREPYVVCDGFHFNFEASGGTMAEAAEAAEAMTIEILQSQLAELRAKNYDQN